MNALREVVIIVSSETTADVYYARSYPDADRDENGHWERYKVPVYKVFLAGTDGTGRAVRKEWTALRFMPFWNDPTRPHTDYKARGWINSGLPYVARKHVSSYKAGYVIHNSRSRFGGAIVIKDHFYIHGGPESTAPGSWGWGAAGCVEVIGNFDDFRLDLIQMAGSTETDIHKGVQLLITAKKLYVQMDLAAAPNLEAAQAGEF